uniref:Uncharacterized protein n=1 Tax=Chelydra serpentina TaxID=8475 RepID=A0A8C3TMZ5_CHESE
MSYYRTRIAKNSRVLDILVSQGERACRLFFYPCLKQVEPNLYNRVKKYVSDVNESIGDARRQLVGYLLEKDKEWIVTTSEQHQEKKDIPRQILSKQERATKEKVKQTQNVPAAKPKKADSKAVSIFDAAAKGDLSDLAKVLRENDINAVNSSNETLLHIAAANGHVAITEYLINKGAKLDVKDKKGRTPVHRAAEKGQDDAVKVLLQNRQNFLHVAALKDESNLAQMLLKNGAPVDAKDETGQTALGYAISQGFEKPVKVLLEAGASIDSNIIDNLHGIYTPLLMACEMGKTETAEVLIAKGASLEQKMPNSNTVLHLAVQAGAVSITNLLLRKGMDANITSQGEQTPLHVAAFHNKGSIVDILINAGAKINAVTKELVTPLHVASQRGNVEVAQQLLHHKANVNVKDKQSKTPLHLAAEKGDHAMVELLLSFNADPNAMDKEKKTPLHTAAMEDHLNTVKNETGVSKNKLMIRGGIHIYKSHC